MATTLGMPKIRITFEDLGLTAIQRSERGVALLILKEDNFPGETVGWSHLYGSMIDVPGLVDEASDQEYSFSEENARYLRLAFAGRPWKLRVEVYDGEERTITDLLESISLARFDYYSLPGQDGDMNQDAILSWQEDVVKNRGNTMKFVGFEADADSSQVINWAVPRVVYDGEEYYGAEFTPYIASALAGLDLQRSFTYYDFGGKISDADMPFVEDEDKAVSEGKLFLTYDGFNYKVARAVNSLVTHTAKVGESHSKIRIVEAMHLILNDIRDTFANSYVGKVINSHENKEQFMALVNRVYFPSLFSTVLEAEGNNSVDIDMEAHRSWIIARGEDPDFMRDIDIRTYNTQSNVFLTGRLSILDAMEDLYIDFKLA